MVEPTIPAAGDSRRGFVEKVVAAVVGGVSVAVPGVVGIVAALNPLRQKSQAGEFVRLTSFDALPADGTPVRFPVIVDRVDAWNRFPNEPIGAVFLRRTGDAKRPVEAIHTVCPHAGCVVEFRLGGEGGRYFCPCHAANFDLAGRRLETPSHSPRDLDTLEVEIREAGEVWVEFKNFRTGTSDKVART
jgi:menaquinol-cytochrome c reductase iron-sulfur subunit